MRKKTGPAANRADTPDESLQSVAANAALLLEEAMGATNHVLSIELAPVVALDGELLIRRTPLPDRILRVVADPVRGTEVIQPVSRWPAHFRSTVRRMRPPWGPCVHDAVLDALIDDFVRDVENLLGTIRFAARVDTQPEDCANIRDDFVLISRTHAARLSLSVND
ncbi:hypothetical protein ACFO5K_17110 [Nocardia halotolerans]|uniref:Uncharacterized protein n=1 Tax=Nocardia halotolerans TaxID=1755878 RepID=A0ABV8VM12_9NOCA